MTDANHQPAQPPQRAADADREAVAEQLRSAVADGRLELAELDDRLSATYAAKTRAELEVVTADLSLPAARAERSDPLHLKTSSGSLTRDGYWTVPPVIVAECVSGSIKLDFTWATCLHREVTVHAHAKSGSITLVVPYTWAVDLDNTSSSSGSIVNKVHGRSDPDAPVIRVSGEVHSGTIRARYPRRSFWDWLLRRPARH